MPANQTNELVHLWAAMYGGIGHLYTPARTERIRPWIPYVLDNGRYAEVVNGLEFDADKYIAFVESFVYREHRPMWIAVPDVPFDGAATLQWWHEWAPRLRKYGVPLAFVVQDGLTLQMVIPLLREHSRECESDAIFVGGTDEYKWGTYKDWAKSWPRVHIGRCNSQYKLEELAALGIESIDGSGWFRGKSPQVVGLGRFLAKQAGQDPDYAAHCALSTRYAHRDQLIMPELLQEVA